MRGSRRRSSSLTSSLPKDLGGGGRQLTSVGVVWVCPPLVRNLFLGRRFIPVRKAKKKVWMAAPLVSHLGNLEGEEQNSLRKYQLFPA